MASKNDHAAFGQRMAAILNAGALNLAIAVGHQTGLFDVLAALKRPQPVARIALEAGLAVPYVREWLGIMTTGRIIELSVDETGEALYFLPAEHAAMLTRKAGSANLAVYAQEIPLLTQCALGPVLQDFKAGSGVPYATYPRFQAFMAELANAKHRRVLVERFLPTVEEGRIVQRLQQGIRVCDFGCGQGVALLLMARAFPQSRFVGLDLDRAAIDQAEQQRRQEQLANAAFIVRDAAALTEDQELAGAFDYVTAFDAIHDQSAPLSALKGVYHLLAPGGRFSMVDIAAHSAHQDNLDHPMGPFLYTVSLMHCLPVGLVGGGTGLGMMWGREKAVAMLKEAGFRRVEVVPIPDDPFNLHYYCRTVGKPIT